MATRFAGDFFGVSLVEPDREESRLLDYYPELRRLAKSGAAQNGSDGDSGARLYGGAKAAPTFTGFKTFERGSGEFKAAPGFFGFQTFDQPNKS